MFNSFWFGELTTIILVGIFLGVGYKGLIAVSNMLYILHWGLGIN